MSWQTDRQFLGQFISWLLVACQWPDIWKFSVKSLHHLSEPYDHCEINSDYAVTLDVHNHTRIPAKKGHVAKRHMAWRHAHTANTRARSHTHNGTHKLLKRMHTHTQIWRIGSDLSDLAASTCVPLLNAPGSSPPSSKHSFAILSKASLMPPITGGLQAGRFGARRLGRRVCYASGPFNRVVICCWWCCSCLCRLINGKLPSLW